jgi:hypothetical protein
MGAWDFQGQVVWGGEELCMQGFCGETYGKKYTWKTEEQMEG